MKIGTRITAFSLRHYKLVGVQYYVEIMMNHDEYKV